MVIVSPALAAANNGNWQTASRWARWLRGTGRVRITDRWPDGNEADDEVMLALHAVRSASALAAWSAQGRGGVGLVLTGTDLYGDFADHPDRDPALQRADRLVVLQAEGPDALPAPLRAKTRVIYQSVPPRLARPKTSRRLCIAVVGHLRSVKAPEVVFDAALRLRDDPAIQWRHVGEADASWRQQVQEVQARCPGYRWLGPLAHGDARRLIQHAHVLVHPSHAEGGAHVVMEAACSGTPVLASRIPGNVGMLGAAYDGYFPPGDSAALAALLRRCRDEQLSQDPEAGLLARLRAQCALRARLFEPAAECAAVRALVQELQDCR